MACYKRAYRAGSLPKRPQNPSERFYSHVDKDGPISPRAPHLGNCWLWTANALPSGYGVIGKGGRGGGTQLAHRFLWELEVGPIPEKATIDHLCFVPACVRRDHLEVVPQKVNNSRATGNQFQLNAAKTECPKGHPYDEANTYNLPRDGGTRTQRICRVCNNAAARAYYQRRKGTV